MIHSTIHRVVVSSLSAVIAASAVTAQNFGNLGGNAQRNGRTAAIGPIAPQLAWADTANISLITWAPFISDGRVHVVRQSDFPEVGGSANDEIITYDLETGNILWRLSLPYNGDTDSEFIAWIAGADSGRLYAGRTQLSKPGPIRALDAATGAILWTSTVTTEAFAHDGVVFTDDGDLIVSDHEFVQRIDGATGSLEWVTPRHCNPTGNCGVAITDDAVFFAQPVLNGYRLRKLDLATGVYLYRGPLIPGTVAQNHAFISTDGTIYFEKSQLIPSIDFLYAYDDTGTSFVERWRAPVRWTTFSEHGVAADGSVYSINQNDEFVRLDPATGQETASAGVLTTAFNLKPYTAVDAAGTVYLSDGYAMSPHGLGHLWAFNEDLTKTHFVLPLLHQSQGGPAVGGDGYLVMADFDGVRAYRAPDQGTSYCGPAVPNSTGQSAELTVRGEAAVGANDLVLRCDSMPNYSFGFFLLSLTQGFVAGAGGGQGNLCLSGNLGRFGQETASTRARGALELRINLNALPQPGGFVSVMAGETWNFQCWFRDAVAGSATSNFSDARSVVFQ